MKNILKYISVCVVLIMTSCENDLDLLPIDTLASDSFFQSENDFKLYANGFYGQLPGFGLSSRDNWADVAYTGGSHSISNSTYIESQESSLWRNSYANIRATTELIEQEDVVEAGLTKDAIQVFKGEAHFFRAMNYFNLLKDFGGVPLIDKTLSLEDEELYGPRASREQIVDFILADLDAAIAAPVGTLTVAADEGRVTLEAARAFKSRVCLFEGTWRKYHSTGGDANTLLDLAIAEANNVINSNNHSLFDNASLGDESYRYFFILESDEQSNPMNLGKDAQNEHILTTKFNKLDRSSGYIATSSGNLSPTKKLIDMFTDDIGLPINHANTTFQGHGFTIDPVTKVATNTEYLNRDLRMNNILIEPFSQFWYHVPYQRDYSLANEVGTGAFNEGFWTSATGYLMHKFIPEIEGGVGIDYPVIRYAEVLLIFAEATFERNGLISDGDLDQSINLLRARGKIPGLTNGFVTANGLDMLSEIRRERTIELYAEGFRFDDLRRWKTAEIEMSGEVKGIQWTNSPMNNSNGYDVYNPQLDVITNVTTHTLKSFPVDANGFAIFEDASMRNFEQNHYLFPLPLRQLLINPQLEQNPGWVSQ